MAKPTAEPRQSRETYISNKHVELPEVVLQIPEYPRPAQDLTFEQAMWFYDKPTGRRIDATIVRHRRKRRWWWKR